MLKKVRLDPMDAKIIYLSSFRPIFSILVNSSYGLVHSKEVRFASFLFGGFITAIDSKGQIISKRLLVSSDSSKKRKNKFGFFA